MNRPLDIVKPEPTCCLTVRAPFFLSVAGAVLISLSPDTPAQLEKRALNAPLLRYVDSVRMHGQFCRNRIRMFFLFIFRRRAIQGHRAATIDPLDLMQREEVAALDPTRYGLNDPSKYYDVNSILWNKSVLDKDGSGPSEDMLTLREIVHRLRTIYVGRISFEYMHSPNKSERLWWSHLLESGHQSSKIEDERKKRIWSLMARSETFDQFLQTKFPNLKRYGLEGGESMLPALDSLFMAASKGNLVRYCCIFFYANSLPFQLAGVENIVLCMPHRGRISFSEMNIVPWAEYGNRSTLTPHRSPPVLSNRSVS